VADASSQALRITGWAWDYKHRQPLSGIVVAADGVTAGLGAVGDWRPLDKIANPRITSNFIGYTGYVRDAPKPGAMKVYGIRQGKSQASACYLATIATPPQPIY